ncbi:UDP-glucose:Glycoprotein glucosyltransferase domain-containing protein [Ditylenchus destructor]|nr:UDP-glucose:Glycoprotein glucosyltransferase domain-containing protein [Ditylenchus destructor]
MIAPSPWMVQPVYAEHDLDNIIMKNVKKDVIAKFELVHILLEGHCFDEVTGNPPRGLQYTLGTQNEPSRYDTIVMANLLKASPGAWELRLREGKSKDIYEIKTCTDAEMQSNEQASVIIDTFQGKTLRIRVAKRPGMENRNLLTSDSNEKGDNAIEDDEGESGGSLWSSISNKLVGGEKHDKINIFSLASGHLYERFLQIMMLSVMKNTKHPVKFWLLNNYLSPIIRKKLPKMAEQYGFEYELIEYKWPKWLHQQTEKQRVMWGYKILFLDVLFPLDVKKIIYVDADQVKFRHIAAGDRLRGQYQGLSSDPNSLSNLDQDLPNNMIHQVRIKSLPQEWLWCETWCDEDSKKSAKTIDLCNNPLTKEPKLDSAMRIVPEWTAYDNEIKALNQEEGDTQHKQTNDKAAPQTTEADHGGEL